jgi:hypothetical protein
MNKIIIILIVLGALAGLYYINNRPAVVVNEPQVREGDTAPESPRPDPTNATFTIDGETVRLSNGKHVRNIGLGGAFSEETAITDAIAYGDINRDGRDDAVVVLARSGGGSGLFLYMAGFVSGATTYRGTEAVFLGDRIIPRSISINQSGIITVEYLDRQPDEPFAAEPTVTTSKQFVFKDGVLEPR